MPPSVLRRQCAGKSLHGPSPHMSCVPSTSRAARSCTVLAVALILFALPINVAGSPSVGLFSLLMAATSRQSYELLL